MKQYATLALCLVLTAALLVGCGCTNQKMDDQNTSAPTVLPTNEEVWDNTTQATTSPTVPTTDATGPSETGATIDRGNGALEDNATNGSNGADGSSGINGSDGSNETNEPAGTDSTMEGRTRGNMPRGR